VKRRRQEKKKKNLKNRGKWGRGALFDPKIGSYDPLFF